MSNEKITIIGFMGSGKTTYLAAMYDVMSYGLKGFTLLETNPNTDLYLQDLWDGIRDDKWPVGTDNIERYNFSLSHAYEEILEFEWMDYPGGILKGASDMRTQFQAQLHESACLFVIVNGERFNVNSSSDEGYVGAVMNNLKRSGDLNAVRELANLSIGQKLPPIAIIITKTDLIPDEKTRLIERTVKKCFEGLFHGNHVVCIIPVSLGDEILTTKIVDPINIECPIAFAVLNILGEYIAKARAARQIYSDQKSTAEGSFWRRFKKDEIEQAKKNINMMEALINKFNKDMFKLLDLFANEKLMYIGGKEIYLKNYFRDRMDN